MKQRLYYTHFTDEGDRSPEKVVYANYMLIAVYTGQESTEKMNTCEYNKKDLQGRIPGGDSRIEQNNPVMHYIDQEGETPG